MPDEWEPYVYPIDAGPAQVRRVRFGVWQWRVQWAYPPDGVPHYSVGEEQGRRPCRWLAVAAARRARRRMAVLVRLRNDHPDPIPWHDVTPEDVDGGVVIADWVDSTPGAKPHVDPEPPLVTDEEALAAVRAFLSAPTPTGGWERPIRTALEAAARKRREMERADADH